MLWCLYPIAGAHGFLTAILLRSGNLRSGVVVFHPGLCLQSVFFFFFSALYPSKSPPPQPPPMVSIIVLKYARFHWLAVWRCPQGGCYSRGCTLHSAAVRGCVSLKGTSHNSHLGTWCTYHWYMYSWLPIKQTLANSNQSRFPLDYFHTFTVIYPR